MIAVIASMTMVELFDEYPSPISSEMMMIVLFTTPINIYTYNLYINGNKKKHQSLLLRGIGSGPGASSPPSSL